MRTAPYTTFERDITYGALCLAALAALISVKLAVLDAASQGAQVISTMPYYNLVDRVSFDEGDGTVAHDSQNGRDIDLSYTGWDTGVQGLAVSFDGASSWGVLRGFNLNGTPGTIALWMDLQPGSSQSTILEGSDDYTTLISGFAVTLNDDVCGTGTLAFKVKGDAGYNIKCYAFPSGGWHHYAFIIDKRQDASNELTLYINGAVATPVSTPKQADNKTLLSNYPLYFMSHAGTSQFTAGKIDELYILNGALNTREVLNLYQNTPGSSAVVLPTSINNITVSGITSNSATISWTTDKSAQDDAVEYGLTNLYGQSTDRGMGGSPGAITHSVSLTHLQPGTTYHFRVSEELGDAYSDDMTFATLSEAVTSSQSTSSGGGIIQGSGSSVTGYGSQVTGWQPTSLTTGQTTTTPGFLNTVVDSIVRAITPSDPAPLLNIGPSAPVVRKGIGSYTIDTAAPSTPQDLVATFVNSHEIDLSWQPSADNIAVVGYKVYRDGELQGTVTDTSYVDKLSIPEASYVYTVAAYDAVDNTSPQSIAEVAVLPNGSLTFLQRMQIALEKIRQLWSSFIYSTGYRINILLNGNEE